MSSRETPLKLSVLDQAPTRTGSSPAESIRHVADLARTVDLLGYDRFWIAEHHAFGAVASTAPETLIPHVAANTQTIRVGSGGMLLPNHRPIHVAEIFRMLAALHPRRIDLGVGRSEGSLNPQVVAAFDRGEQSSHAGGYEQMLDELLSFAALHTLAPEHPLHGLQAGPAGEPFPEVFMLGSSPNSARTAAAKGLGYAFAAYSAPTAVTEALSTYRQTFQPGPQRDTPHAILGVRVIVGENDEHAHALHAPSRLALAQARTENPQPLVDPETALKHNYTDAERQVIDEYDASWDVIGGPETVATRLEELVAHTQADEVITTSNTFDPADRIASYERLSRATA